MIPVLLSGLAGWRVAVFLVSEKGPFDLALKLRQSLGIQYNKAGEATEWPHNLLTSLLTCIWCLSFWTSFAALGLYWLWPPLIFVPAAWGVAGLLEACREVSDG